jgi:hypothetical protein
VADDRSQKVGSSGIFKAIVMSARRIKRALSEGDTDLPEVATDVGTSIAQSFVSGQLDDVWLAGTRQFRERNPQGAFVERWKRAIQERGALKAFEVSNAGTIDLQYVPGLEDVPQSEFVAFVEIVFGTETVPLDNEKAFAVGAVLLLEDGNVRLGALHAR